MKLADAETASARESLRESNLDDLENAFKNEMPLTGSYDEQSSKQTSEIFVDFPNRDEVKRESTDDSKMNGKGNSNNLASTHLTSDVVSEGVGTGVGRNKISRIMDPFDETSTAMASGLTATNEANGNSEKRGLTAYDPYSNAQRNRGASGRANVGGYSYVNQNPTFRQTSASGYGPLNPPPDQYDYFNYSRRCKIITFVLLLAIIGLAFGLLIPGTRRESNLNLPNEPTQSPIPALDTVYDELFVEAVDVLNDAMISAPFTLSKSCHQELCGGDGNLDNLDIRDQVMHYLVFEDALFRGWVFEKDFDNVERVIQRYIITLFAFSTGLKKRSVDGDDGFIMNTWARNDNWLDGKDECNWYGVTCERRSAYVNVKDFVDHTKLVTTAIARDLPNRPVENIPMIIELRLNQNKLKGDLVPELFKMRHLERLELWKAELHGTIDPSIKLLTSLKKLWLHENTFLEGSLPDEIGLLSNLESVFVGGNKLTGVLPDMTEWKNLKTLAVHGNKIGGSIPKSIQNAIKLKRLFLDDNKFNGTLPIELGLLEELTDVRVNKNDLEGALPLQLGLLNKLEILYLHNNNFDGTLNDILLTGWPNMKHFEAQNNNFVGAISTLFATSMTNLVTLNLSSNKLNSMIPSGFCGNGEETLKKLDLSSNQYVTGQIPASLADCANMETLILSNNRMVGELPPFLSTLQRLETLRLDRNQFSGEVPPNIGGSNIRILDLVENNLDGSISTDLCSRTSFISADCNSTGSIQCRINCCDCCSFPCNGN